MDICAIIIIFKAQKYFTYQFVIKQANNNYEKANTKE